MSYMVPVSDVDREGDFFDAADSMLNSGSTDFSFLEHVFDVGANIHTLQYLWGKSGLPPMLAGSKILHTCTA